MIGFKTIDDYTFDACVNYLNTHNDSDEDWHEITGRYTMLLRQLEKEDDRLFLSCRTIDDFKKYLSHLPALGTQLYHRKHTKEAKEAIDKILAAQKKKNKQATVVGLLLGVIVGLPSLRYLPYLVAYWLKDESDYWSHTFQITCGVLFILLIIARYAKKKIAYNRYIAFFGGMLIAYIPMFCYLDSNKVSYRYFSHYGIYDGDSYNSSCVGIADCLGNIVIPKKYSCFYEIDPNIIIGVTANASGILSTDWYDWYDRYEENGGYISSEDFWIVDDNNTSLSLKEAIEGESETIVHSWSFNNLDIVTRDGEKLHYKDRSSNRWHDPEILELRVIKKSTHR